MRHLSPDVLLDLAEGTRAEAGEPHLDVCRDCRAQVEELRTTFAIGRGVDVPEPSPLFWDHLSARVRKAVEAEALTRPSWPFRFSWLNATLATTVAAAIAVALVLRAPKPAVNVVPDPNPAVAVAGVQDVPVLADVDADDPSLQLITDLAADLDWDSAEAAGLSVRGGVERAVLDLSNDERVELRKLLKQELGGSGV